MSARYYCGCCCCRTQETHMLKKRPQGNSRLLLLLLLPDMLKKRLKGNSRLARTITTAVTIPIWHINSILFRGVVAVVVFLFCCCCCRCCCCCFVVAVVVLRRFTFSKKGSRVTQDWCYCLLLLLSDTLKKRLQGDSRLAGTVASVTIPMYHVSSILLRVLFLVSCSRNSHAQKRAPGWLKIVVVVAAVCHAQKKAPGQLKISKNYNNICNNTDIACQLDVVAGTVVVVVVLLLLLLYSRSSRSQKNAPGWPTIDIVCCCRCPTRSKKAPG